MAQQLVNVGIVASDGTGDELREAFTKVNENFTELYSGNVQVTAANIRVFSVAGRTGNVVLSVSDVAQAASKPYVDSAIASNIAAFSGSVVNGLRANIEAANIAISSVETRVTTIEGNLATQEAAIDLLGATKASFSYVDTSIALALSSNAQTANIIALQSGLISTDSNVAAIQTTVNGLSSTSTSLTANAGVQAVRLNSLDANVAAANLEITSIKNTVTSNDTDISILVANAATQAGQLLTINANVSAANASIGILNSNVGVLASQISGLTANAASQSADISSLSSFVGTLTSSVAANAAAQSLEISSLWANAATQAASIVGLNANAATQGNSLVVLNSRVDGLVANSAEQYGQILAIEELTSTHSNTLVTLSANAAAQTLEISNLFSNVGVLSANAASQASALGNLTANAATQATSLNALTANATAQALQISSLQTNTATVAGQVSSLEANIGILSVEVDGQTSNVLSLQNTFGQLVSNAAAQAIQIASVNANVATANDRIDSVALDITSLYANAATQSDDILSLNANTSVNASAIGEIIIELASTNSNVETVVGNVSILQETAVTLSDTKANISGATFTGNIEAPNLLVASSTSTDTLTANIVNTQTIGVGNSTTVSLIDTPLTVAGNVEGNLRVSITNASNTSVSSTGAIFLANDGSVVDRNLQLAIASGSWTGNFTVPAGDTGVGEFAYDSHLTAIGGNLSARTDNSVSLVANTAVITLAKDSDLILTNANLRFSDGTIQTTAIQDVEGLYLTISTLTDGVNNNAALLGNVGNLSYTPANVANWNGSITNIQQALDEIAQRLRDINA